jgi:sodium/proline symporter
LVRLSKPFPWSLWAWARSAYFVVEYISFILEPHDLLIAISFGAFVLLFLGVGIYSGLNQKSTAEDYLLASREANPWLTGLSTMATGNSGFMFIGLIGFTYTLGVASVWIILGWIVGEAFAWNTVHHRLRHTSEQVDSATVVSYLSQEDKTSRWLTLTSGLITIAFLAVYAATQLQAGSKALSVIFGWDYNLGILLGAVIVTIYCFAGGIRASIWVGSIQATLMLISMLILVTVAVIHSGGPIGMFERLGESDPALLSLAPDSLQLGVIPFALSWFVAGFGVVGQPHIMSRIMAIDSTKNVAIARNIYLLLYVVFAISALGVGLTARVLLPELLALGGDTELALPELATTLLPALLVGIVLSGIFAATISTADAQLLTCSATLSQDIFHWASDSYRLVKAGTLVMALFILVIALVGNDNVFALATIAWSTLAAGLGPLMVVRVWERAIKTPVAIAMMLVGVSTALTWRLGFGLSDSVCEAFPGMVAGALVYLVSLAFGGGEPVESDDALVAVLDTQEPQEVASSS